MAGVVPAIHVLHERRGYARGRNAAAWGAGMSLRGHAGEE